MKIRIYILLGLILLFLMLLFSCHQAEETSDTEETTSAIGELITEPAHTESPVTEPETEAETEPETTAEPLETVAPAPEAQVHVVNLKGKTVGNLDVAITDLTADMEKEKTHVRVVTSLGYTCEGFSYRGISYEGNLIPLSLIEKDKTVTLRMGYATYELPIINISVSGQEINSKTEYVDMIFSLENTKDVMLEVPGGIRLRGNSTADMPKKPYRIKFEQKQSLFGLEKAKSWVLLAEYLDPSCLHNYAAMYLGAASDELSFTPTVHHVNLYLDGEYMGLYSLCEQVQVNAGRLDIETEITGGMRELMDFNFLVRMDERAPEEDQPYFYVASVGRYFQLKYPAPEDFTSEKQFKRFMTQLENYYNDMAQAFNTRNTGWIRKNIDTGSLIDHIIVDQIMGEKDHVWKSFYTYHNATDETMKGKISFGPIWDYDYSLYIPWTGEPNESYTVDTSIAYSNFFYQGFMGTPYAAKVTSQYKHHYADVLDELIPHLQKYRDGIKESLALNQARWYSYDPDLTEDNFEFMIRFFKSRQKVLGKAWN